MKAHSSARKYRGVEVALSLYTGTIAAKDLWKKIDTYIDALALAPQLLNIPGNIRIIIRPIKGTVHGRYTPTYPVPTIEVDPRYELVRSLETLMHELVHAEQYHTKKLTQFMGKFHWDGKPYRNATSYAAYRALPWEAEAFERAPGLAQQVLALLGRRTTKVGIEISTVKATDSTIQVQPKATTIDPDAELRVELREALIAEGKYSMIVIENLVQGDVLNQARRLGLI